MAARLRVTLRRSTVGTNPSARGTVRALGLHRIGQTVELADDPATARPGARRALPRRRRGGRGGAGQGQGRGQQEGGGES